MAGRERGTRARTKRAAGRSKDDAAAARPERLQKVLARAGLGSRREMERWIEEGRVKVGGRVARVGESVTPGEAIEVDGRCLGQEALFPSRLRILAYYKPEGELVSRRDPQGRPTVFQQLPGLPSGSWRAVGRLDLNTSGLLLFTTHGELANRLMHPSTGIDREYAVRVRGTVSGEAIRNLLAGVELEDGPARFTDIVEVGGEGANRWYHVCLMEGRHREVRRLWESQGVQVSRLIRVRFGPIVLPRSARPGQFWDLDREQVDALLEWSGMERLKGRVANVEERGRGK